MAKTDTAEPTPEAAVEGTVDTAPAADTPAEDTPANADSVDTDEDTDEDPNPGTEAARWRRKLRDAEAERDQLAARVEALQRRQAEDRITAAGVKPAAVWAVTELAAVLGDDGLVDAEKLAAAVEAAREQLGIAKPAKGTYVPGVGSQPNALPRVDQFTSAFKPKRR